MSVTRAQLEALLQRVLGGAADLAPDEIDALAAHLNDTPSDAARLADRAPLLGAVPPVERPRPAEWERVWSAIDGAFPETPRLNIVHADELEARLRLARLLGDEETQAPPSRSRARRLSWPALAALAACIAVAALFRLPRGEPPAAESLQLAGDVEILDIDAEGGATPLLVPLVNGSPVVIWSFEDQGA